MRAARVSELPFAVAAAVSLAAAATSAAAVNKSPGKRAGSPDLTGVI